MYQSAHSPHLCRRLTSEDDNFRRRSPARDVAKSLILSRNQSFENLGRSPSKNPLYLGRNRKHTTPEPIRPRKLETPEPVRPRKLEQLTVNTTSRKSLQLHGRVKRRYESRLSPDKSLDQIFHEKSYDIPKVWMEDIFVRYNARSNFFKNFAVGDCNSFQQNDSPEAVFSRAWIYRFIAPVPILSKLENDKLVLNRYNLKLKLWEALAETIPYLKTLKFLHLDENNISDAGGAALLASIASNENIKSFYYTKNVIGKEFAKAVEDLTGKQCSLKEINLGGCKAPNNFLSQSVKYLWQLPKIQTLSLSGIGLNDYVMQTLSASLKTSQLSHLDLSNNLITAQSTRSFFLAIRRNETIRFLNYSKNTLCSEECLLARAIAKLIRRENSLMHIDLSETWMNDRDGRVIVRAAEISQTLIGLHMSGNNFSRFAMREFGNYLKFTEEISFIHDSADTCPPPLRSPSPDITTLSRDDSVRKINQMYNLKYRDHAGRKVVFHRDNLVNLQQFTSPTDLVFTRVAGLKDFDSTWKASQHCWICEKWNFHSFEIRSEDLQEIQDENVLKFLVKDEKYGIRSSFWNWEFIEFPNQGEPEPDEKDTKGWNQFQSSASKFKQNQVPEKQEEENEPEDKVFSMTMLIPPGQHHLWITNNRSLYVAPQVYIDPHSSVQYVQSLMVNTLNMPLRKGDPPLNTVEKDVIERFFSKPKSIFRTFIEDDDSLYAKMLENDNRFSKLNRLVKDEEQYRDLMGSILLYYGQVKEIFEYYAVISSFPVIGWMDFSHFCDKCDIIDNKYLKISALDQIYKAVNFEIEDLEDNPDNALCRYEFFEILVRLAVQKYTNLNLTPRKAFERILEDLVLPSANASNEAVYRRNAIYNLPINDILEMNEENIKAVYNKLKLPSTAKMIKIKRVEDLLSKIDPRFTKVDFLKAWSFSKMSVLDEMEQWDAYNNMMLVEFMEFLPRYADFFVEKNEELPEKLRAFLDVIFKPFGLRQKFEGEVDSDVSDGFY